MAIALANEIRCGELIGVTSATQLPDIAGGMVIFKASAANAGAIYLGGAGVTKADGATDATTGIQLTAGDMLPPMPLSNLNQLYRICDNVGDCLTYLIVV